MNTKKDYYVYLNIETQLFEVIDCTHFKNQPVVKSFKYEQCAHNYKSKLSL
jgi:hypothetical protein